MTTHDYPGQTNRESAVNDPAPVNADPAYENAPASTTTESSMSPGAATDPGPQPPADQSAALHENPRANAEEPTEASLFASSDLAELRRGWDSVQAGFVDDPKRCVQQADSLVSDVVAQLSSGFATARERLERQWSRGEDASTEDLRVALKRYREFFDRLLAV